MESFDNTHFLAFGDGEQPIYWAHGWGQSHKAFLPWAERFKAFGKHVLLDFAGHGASPIPPTAWGTEDYADEAAKLIKAREDGKPVIWVGHSFGCRVGLQLAARHPELIAGLCLIAGAGLKRKRSLWQRLYFGGRIKLFKLLKKLIPLGLSQDWLYTKFGSPDYKNAGEMRKIFVKVVNEDLSEVAQKIQCPVTLIYGSDDQETPPEIGERLHKLIKNSKLIVLDGFDHYTLLSGGQHQAAGHLDNLIKSVKS